VNIAARIEELQRQGWGKIKRRGNGGTSSLGYLSAPSEAKRMAARAVQKALQYGWFEREPCEVCGHKRVVAHHDDYAKPLTVRWLCYPHHHAWHREHGEAANP
jgi:ribosomal protein S27AE